MLNRRTVLKVAGAASALLPPACASASIPRTESDRISDGSPSITGPYLDLTSPEGNVEAYARVVGNTDPSATSFSWYSGRVMGIRPNEAGRDLMGIIGMGAVRMQPLKDEAGYQMLRKELGFFTDLETGDVIDTWDNPYTEETSEVVHLANPAINAKIVPYRREQGLYEEVGEVERTKPFILPWQLINGRVMTEQHVNLYVKNPMDPNIWRRESAGEFIQISDSNTFNVSINDLQNRELTKVESFGNWTHSRPWQPWMLMGQSPGGIQYNCFTGSAVSLENMPKLIVALARERFPGFLVAPTEVTPPESSLARYMRTRTPAHQKTDQP